MEKDDVMENLLVEIKEIASKYYTLTCKPLGVTGEVAELEAAQRLGLTLADARTPGYDALRVGGGVTERFQIKGRAVDPTLRYVGRVPSIDYDAEFDWVLLVLLDRSTYNPLEIWQASRGDVVQRLEAPGSKARNERNSLAISQFKSIARKVWPNAPVVLLIPSVALPGSQALLAGSHEARQTIDIQVVTKFNKVMSRAEAIASVRRRCVKRKFSEENCRFANVNKALPVWWLEIPIKMLHFKNGSGFVDLLLWDDSDMKIHHLAIPMPYLTENLRRLPQRHDKNSINLTLSSSIRDQFTDTRSGIRFQQFLCECSK